MAFRSEPGQRDLASRPSKHGLWQIFQSEPGQRDLASRPSTFAFFGNREGLQGSDALPGALGHLAIGELSRKGGTAGFKGKGGSKRRQQKGASFFFIPTTPRKINMQPENTPLEKENHLPNHFHSFSGSMLIFRGVSTIQIQ